MNQRVIYLDIIRVLACLMVVLMHSPQPYSAGNIVLSSISFLTTPCIGLFFMVSGALLLPVSKPTPLFLKYRIAKIAMPVIFWSLVYLVLNYLETKDIEALLKSIISIPFSVQGCGIFWFVYVLIGLYLIAPIISAWLLKTSKCELEFYLLLWAVTMCYPIIRFFILLNEGTSGILYYFAGYVGYFVLGYYLHNYASHWKGWILTTLLVLPIGSAVICKLSGVAVNFYDVFWYLSISVAAMCVALFMIIKEMANGRVQNTIFKKIIVDLSNCSFGIYLIHFFVVRDVLWRLNLAIIPNCGGILETFILGVVISYIIVRLIAILPKAEYIIGVKRR